MRVAIVRRGVVVDEALSAFVHSKVESTLGRLEHEVRSVRIQLEDTNGPRGGMDKRCVVSVSGDRFKVSVVETRDASLHAAVAQALHIVSRTVIRALQRDRHLFGLARRSSRSLPASVVNR